MLEVQKITRDGRTLEELAGSGQEMVDAENERREEKVVEATKALNLEVQKLLNADGNDDMILAEAETLVLTRWISGSTNEQAWASFAQITEPAD